jgi:diguanylate cyclase
MPKLLNRKTQASGREQLVQANEQLVVTALRAQTDAAAANRALALLTKSSDLDSLTELPNRHSLLSRFKYAVALARRTGTQLAILFVDLNDFKQINDTLGHAVGDQVLRLVAKRLATAVRESDTVSRHGGDEFLILLSDISRSTDVIQIATKLIAALARPARVGEHLLRLTASIGISLFPSDGEEIEMLIQRADAAMYRAKRADGGFAFHETTALEQGQSPPCPPPKTPQVMSQFGAVPAGQLRRRSQLHDANEQLIMAGSGTHTGHKAQHPFRAQPQVFAVAARQLRKSLVNVRRATALLDRAHSDAALLPRVQIVIERQVTQMARLIDDLLNASRMGATVGLERLVQCQVLDLTDAVNAAVAACRPGIDLRLQHLNVRMPSESLDCCGDLIRLTQVFRNLLDNASKYSKDSASITLLINRTPSSLVIRVCDSGIGMSSEKLSTILQPCVQDVAVGRSNLGTGLIVVRELVLAHGGTITVSSDGPGLGSTFTVTLPIAAARDSANDGAREP